MYGISYGSFERSLKHSFMMKRRYKLTVKEEAFKSKKDIGSWAARNVKYCKEWYKAHMHTA